MSGGELASGYGLPVLITLFVWWFSTGIVLYLDQLPRRTFRYSLLGATGLLLLALLGLAKSSALATPAAAYAAFACAVLVWGWNEMSFLMGFLTGPRTSPCPEGCGGWRHFGHAVQTVLYHELAILVSALAVVALTWGAPNQVGTWTFMVLWGMRLSAKLNVFLGVPNLSESLLPDHLRYLERFFTRRSMNLLFPVSVTVSTLVTAALVRRALAPAATGFEVTGSTLLATMMALAVLEHWFLVLPLPTTRLWSWGLRPSAEPEPLPPASSGLRLHRLRDDPGPALEQKAAERGRDG